ncbi:MAG TPA: FAD-dependent oxidoreductase [Polyangiaceae bacterium]|nr:FAD-dependent oxidoreductase [Polyangiaceae bacterium]
MGKDVLVVGAGIIGLSIAYYATRKGHRVRVLDRGTPASMGCSYGNAGMIVPSHFVPLAAPGMVALALRCMADPESPFYLKPRPSAELAAWAWRFFRSANAEHVARAGPFLRDAHLQSRACFQDWSDEWGEDFGLSRRGLLLLCKTEHGLKEEARTAEVGRELGIPSELFSASDAMRLEPDLRMEVAGAIYFPLDCHLSPRRLMAALIGQLDKAGVAFHWETSVEGWRERNGRIQAARTSRGELVADEYVLAGGVWSTELARALGLRLPMEAGKGYSLTLDVPPRLPRLCAILSEARVAVTPMGPSLRFGGTMELAGVDTAVDLARVRGIAESVGRYLPDFPAETFRSVRAWCGLRPCSPDGLPYLGRWPEPANLIAATGHAMMGVSLGPVSGKLVAEMLSDEAPSIALDLVRPDRFASRQERARKLVAAPSASSSGLNDR